MWIYLNNPIWIKKEEINKIYWSKDKDLKQKVKSYDFFNEDDEEWLERILNWEEINSNDYEAIYSLQWICNIIWKQLPYQNDIKLWIESEYIEKHLKEDFWIDFFEEWDLFFKEFLNFIPEQDNLPIYWIISLERLKEIQKYFSKINIKDKEIKKLQEESEIEEEEEKWYAYEHIKWIKKNIDFCIENDLDLIIFAY